MATATDSRSNGIWGNEPVRSKTVINGRQVIRTSITIVLRLFRCDFSYIQSIDVVRYKDFSKYAYVTHY